MGVDDVIPSQKKEKKRKETRRKSEVQNSVSETVTKHGGSKNNTHAPAEYPDEVVGEQGEKHAKNRKDVVNPVDEDSGSKHKMPSNKKKRGLEEGTSDDHQEVEKKKRKKDKSRGEGEDGVQESKKKKRKSKTGFPNPTADASLSNQARKALTYAFTRFHEPSSWKFNKARQNWLIRNYWTNEMIPELYIPLLTGYLANVQGRVRENLINQCRAILEPPDTKTTAPAEPSSKVPESNAQQIIPTDNNDIKPTRARALLDVLVPCSDM